MPSNSCSFGIFGIVIASALSILACGPNFPNRLIENGDDAVLQAPVAKFSMEIDRIMPRNVQGIETRWMPADTLKYRETVKHFDISELEEIARTNRDFSAEQLQAYKAVREAMCRHDVALAAWSRLSTSAPPVFISQPVPTGHGIPSEFSIYLAGAVCWYQGQTNWAVHAWRRLLDLPPAQRRHRSTWAAFMLGKAMLNAGEYSKSAEWFQLVRRLAREGFHDSLGLAASSLGWEARGELRRRNYERAIDLYLAQLATGDETTAFNSLRYAAGSAWRASPDEMKRFVMHPTTRKVLVAYALAHNERAGPSSDTLRRFIAAVEQSGIPVVEEADRLAWAAYKAGDMELAGRFHAVAPHDSVMTALLGAKLLLRKGEEQQAIAQLSSIARSFPEAQVLPYRFGDELGREWGAWDLGIEPLGERIRGELGVLHLARQEYVSALDMLLRGGYWQDAAYVAERVLTLDELRKYVDKNWPIAEYGAVEKALQSRWGASDMGAMNENIRYLLGRRLVRMGCMEDARPYLPPSLHPALDALSRHLRVGGNDAKSRTQRGEALWNAACITRYLGMELMGTELDPDWTVYYGVFAEPAPAVTRQAMTDVKLNRPSTNELALARNHAPAPDERFHYRRRAADLAWRAAALMPDETDKTAEVLCTAGEWIKKKDPKGADRFYKELVRRCGATTTLGQQAAGRHWFPEYIVDKQRLLREALGKPSDDVPLTVK